MRIVAQVNQSLAKKGVMIDWVVREQKEFGKPAARLMFFTLHSNAFFQKPVVTRLGYLTKFSIYTPQQTEADHGDDLQRPTTTPQQLQADDKSGRGASDE